MNVGAYSMATTYTTGSLGLGMVMVKIRVSVSVSYLNRNFVVVLVNSFFGAIYRVALWKDSAPNNSHLGKNFAHSVRTERKLLTVFGAYL